jgi:hypothetical protein
VQSSYDISHTFDGLKIRSRKNRGMGSNPMIGYQSAIAAGVFKQSCVFRNTPFPTTRVSGFRGKAVRFSGQRLFEYSEAHGRRTARRVTGVPGGSNSTVTNPL